MFGFFNDHYPYTNMHNVNLDWILQAVKTWGAMVELNNTRFENLDTAMADFRTTLLNEWQEYQESVNNYLYNLDVQEEINNKLDDMLESGQLSPYFAPYIQTDVNSWLSTHITNPSNPPLDSSLTIASAAAPAKTVGDQGFLYRGSCANQDLNNVTKYGFYNLASADFATLTNAPDNITFGGGFLLVSNSLLDTRALTQMLVDTVSGAQLIRYRNIQGTWRDWTTCSIPDLGLCTNRSFDDLKKPGIYRMMRDDYATMTDRPDLPLAFEGGHLIVIKTIRDGGFYQILFDVVLGKFAARYCNIQGIWRNWIYINYPSKKWLAIGDSITYGVYSTGASSTQVDQNKCYSQLTADRLGLVLTNDGKRGMGYVASGGGGTLTDALVNLPAGTFDIVSLALGVNDYNTSNVSLGTISDLYNPNDGTGNTIFGKCRYACEFITNNYPAALFVLITPLLCNRHGGTAAGCYDLNIVNGGKSLLDVANAIIDIANLYNIPVINMTTNSAFNALNMTALSLDGVHPTLDGHKVISSYINSMFPH